MPRRLFYSLACKDGVSNRFPMNLKRRRKLKGRVTPRSPVPIGGMRPGIRRAVLLRQAPSLQDDFSLLYWHRDAKAIALIVVIDDVGVRQGITMPDFQAKAT